jgi:hypothetical protein
MVKPGDPILQHLTAAWFNNVNAATRAVGGNRPRTESISNQLITVVNHSTDSKGMYEPVALGSPKFDYNVPLGQIHNNIVFNTKDLDNEDPHNWVILQSPLPGRVGAAATALVLGISWMVIDVTYIETNDFLQVKENLISASSDPVVSYSYEGKGQVIWKDDSIYASEDLLLVSITAPPIQRTLFFTLTENMFPFTMGTYITARALANFYDYAGNLLFQEFLHSYLGIIDDKEIGFSGQASLINNTWIFTQAPCDTPISS